MPNPRPPLAPQRFRADQAVADRLTVGMLRDRLEGLPDHLTVVEAGHVGAPLYYELSSQPYQYLVEPHFMLTAPDRGEDLETTFRLTGTGLEILRGSHVEHQSLPELVAALAKIIRERRDADDK